MDIELTAQMVQLRDAADELWELMEVKRNDVKRLVKRARCFADTVLRHQRADTTEFTPNPERAALIQDTVDRALANVDLLEIFRLELGGENISRALRIFPGQPLMVDEQTVADVDAGQLYEEELDDGFEY